jgi:2,3-bisphosphoglycerate-independent phosphoglycerate mutase
MGLIESLARRTDSKIVLMILDGLGGFPGPDGRSELEVASTPHLDELARNGALGLATPVAPGVTPGSGPGHLALFGYDPIANLVGRGILDILGTGVDLRPGDVAARLNFCTVDAQGAITDRRAGRIPTEVGSRLVDLLNESLNLSGVEARVHIVKEYRGALVLRGQDLYGNVTDTDPQVLGKPRLQAVARDTRSEPVAAYVNDFSDQAARLLAQESPANMVLVRGIDRYDSLPTLQERYQLNPACIAVYPMYRGVSKLVGMDVLEAGNNWSEQVGRLEDRWADFDFFFIHYKYTDSRGEDGDFDAKVATLEEVDREVGRIATLQPDILAVCGDHSTPSALAAHSWHPVPLLLSGKWVFPDATESFSERQAQRGGLGHVRTRDIMAQLMAHAGKLEKYGA